MPLILFIFFFFVAQKRLLGRLLLLSDLWVCYRCIFSFSFGFDMLNAITAHAQCARSSLTVPLSRVLFSNEDDHLTLNLDFHEVMRCSV